jgi:hypothetical protein
MSGLMAEIRDLRNMDTIWEIVMADLRLRELPSSAGSSPR